MATLAEVLDKQVGDTEDEALAMRFAFMVLVQCLDDAGVLPRAHVLGALGAAAGELRDAEGLGPDDLSPVAARVDELRAWLAQQR